MAYYFDKIVEAPFGEAVERAIVIVRQTENGQIEVAAVDPVASMQAIANPQLRGIAEQVQGLLKRVVAEV